MEQNKIAGILSIILGLIFIIFPVISTGLVSILIGVSLVFLGIASLLSGFSAFNVIVGILAIIFGLLFIFNISALSLATPLFAAILIGITLIVEGISLYIAE